MTFITLDSILSFLAHLGTGFGLILAGLIIFALTTKYSERKLIKEGNMAVALKLWGKRSDLPSSFIQSGRTASTCSMHSSGDSSESPPKYWRSGRSNTSLHQA